MEIDLNNISIKIADKDNENHKRCVLKIFNENIQYFHLTKEPISYDNHSKWWDANFKKEYIYLILFHAEIVGYIRLTKKRTETKEKHEISIALLKQYQKSKVGSYSYKLFENEIKKLGVKEIIANTEISNIIGQNFFESNNFSKYMIKFKKKI